VTATAARLLAKEGRRLTSFTAVPQPATTDRPLLGRFGNEGPGAAKVAALYPNIDHLRINVAGRDLISSSRRYARLTGQPVLNPTNLLWIDAISMACESVDSTRCCWDGAETPLSALAASSVCQISFAGATGSSSFR